MRSLSSPRVALTASLVAAVAVVVTTAAGCGVSPSAPEDRGDRLQVVAPVGDQVLPVPQPTANSPDGLVTDFLMAAVGGGESAAQQVKAFLTQKALDAWRDPESPNLTVVRLVDGPVVGVGTAGRFPVTVDYQIVGQLNPQGRVDDLSRPAGGRMTFWVVRDPDNPNNLSIDEIQDAPSGLLISDTALTSIYRIQPVYFWDTQGGQLIPDLRYLPLTLTEDMRATRLVQWLAQGPSPWLAGVRTLPNGTAVTERVAIRDGKYVVNLNGAVTADGVETVEHLQVQLRWSLSNGTSSRPVDLLIDGKPQAFDSGDTFRQFNRAWLYRETRSKFEIVDRRVVPAGGAVAPTVLASVDNQEVYRASVNHDDTTAALVRVRPNGQRYLQIIRDGQATITVDLSSSDMGRPSWVPDGTDKYVVVVSGGHLYLVNTTDGTTRNITPNRVEDVSAAAVSPDGRRIAFIAGGQAYVSSLVAGDETLGVGSFARPILADTVAATGLAWLNETWLNIGGMAGGEAAMWRVTADGVVGRDESGNLRGLTVTEVVAAPVWPSTYEFAEVIIYTPNGPYLFGTSTTQTSQQFPFFGG